MKYRRPQTPLASSSSKQCGGRAAEGGDKLLVILQGFAAMAVSAERGAPGPPSR